MKLNFTKKDIFDLKSRSCATTCILRFKRYHADMGIEKKISPLKIKKNNSKQKETKMSSKNKID